MQTCNLKGQGSNPVGAEVINGAEGGEGGAVGGGGIVEEGGDFVGVGDFVKGGGGKLIACYEATFSITCL